MKRLLVLVLALTLCVSITAWAEEPPGLPGSWAVQGLPGKTTFPVYTGPGEEYFVAAEGNAKVSTQGSILCYGRTGEWLMIRYAIDNGARVGYIDAGEYPDVISGFRELAFGSERYRLPYSMGITDNPYKAGKKLGTISGEVTLLACEYRAGRKEWAYVEGVLDNRDGAKVRGFVAWNSFDSAEPLPAMPDVARADVSLVLLEQTELLTETIPTAHLRVHPLADGTLTLAYCDRKSTMVQRFDLAGALLWSSRVFAASEYVAVTPEENGFTVGFYHNNQLMAYTWPLDSQEAVFSSDTPSLRSLWAAETQSPAARLMSVPVLRATVVGEIQQGTLLLAAFDDGCGLYLLAPDGLLLVERFAGEAELCSPADETGVFSLVLWGDGRPLLNTYQWE